MKLSLHIYFFICCFIPVLCLGQKGDTLRNVKVTAIKTSNVTALPLPLQILNTTEAYKTNSLTVADALKHFAGVTVKDYGGIGGLKTVSIRSLGANYTGILYDGIALGDAQGGQIDLGKFSFDNIIQIELYNSGPVDILSSAKAFSYGSLLLLKTSTDLFTVNNREALTLKLQTGSFGYISPSVLYKHAFGKNIKTSFNAMYQSAKSQYPFNSYENANNIEKRLNSDIKAYRFEYDATLRINDSNKISLQTYFYHSERGLPGAVILYNNISNQRLSDRNFFVQSTWQKKFDKKNELLISAKFAADKNYYIDPSYPNNYGKLENIFLNNELYLSAAYSYKLSKISRLSFSSDILKNKLTRTDILANDFANPVRNSFLNNVAFQIKKQHFEVLGNVLYTVLNNNVATGKTGGNLHRFSNGLSAGIQPLKNIPLRLRTFYKHTFRAPTFNDLYYTNVGNTNLKPEFADQLNVGLTFNLQQMFFVQNFSITADAYLNKVNDKIITIPQQNLFQWSVQNIGKVNIKGVDVAVHAKLREWKNLLFSADIAYGFQQVLDVTDKNLPGYKLQLPYTPKHSGSATFSVEYKQALFNYNVIFSSYRYKQGDAIFENLLQPWATNDVSFSYLLGKKEASNYKIIFEANNIFNTRYEIIKYYPVPGFNYRITLNISFKK